MKKYYKIILLAVSVCIVGDVSAQDIHFSQFYMAPTNLNPALTGVMNCNTRIIANYRNQWSPILKNDAYSTYSVSYDQKMPVGRYDYFGFGANVWNDRAGSLDFGTVTAKLLGAYSKRVGGSRKKSHYVSVGAEAGISQRGFDLTKAQWSTFWNGTDIDPTLGAGEDLSLVDDQFLFADIGLGVLWFSVLDDNTNFYVGAALNHINQANVSVYIGDLVSYYTKSVLHAGGEFPLSDKVSLVPGIVTFFQGPSFELNGGTSFRFDMGSSRYSEQSFQLGAWIRLANHYEDPILTDAIILSTRFDVSNWGVGFSYDINVSSLRQGSNANGSFEFSMIYYFCGQENRGVYCPKF
jgi:type IX secretion system PorP/SprF family membrane protein